MPEPNFAKMANQNLYRVNHRYHEILYKRHPFDPRRRGIYEGAHKWENLKVVFPETDVAFVTSHGIPKDILHVSTGWNNLGQFQDNQFKMGYTEFFTGDAPKLELREMFRVCAKLAVLHHKLIPATWLPHAYVDLVTPGGLRSGGRVYAIQLFAKDPEIPDFLVISPPNPRDDDIPYSEDPTAPTESRAT